MAAIARKRIKKTATQITGRRLYLSVIRMMEDSAYRPCLQARSAIMAYDMIDLVRSRKIGSPTTKLVLFYAAERASQKTGKGIFPSVGRWAAETDLCENSVRSHIRKLMKMGLLLQVGERPSPNGPIKVYDLNVKAIRALPLAYSRAENEAASCEIDDDRQEDLPSSPPQEVHPTPARDEPHPRTSCTPPLQEVHPNRPLTVPEPSFNHDGSDEPDDFRENAEKRERQKPHAGSQQTPEVDHFAEFWKAYPPGRKTDKPKARTLFDQIVTGKVKNIDKTDPEVIVRAAKAYAATKPEEKYTPMPARWLQGARWEEYPDRPEQKIIPKCHPNTSTPIWENLA